MHDPQQERDFYRCLVSDASSRALLKIRDILADDALDDPACFQRIEDIVSLLEDLGVRCVFLLDLCAIGIARMTNVNIVDLYCLPLMYSVNSRVCSLAIAVTRRRSSSTTACRVFIRNS